jgi:hypothetical protein
MGAGTYPVTPKAGQPITLIYAGTLSVDVNDLPHLFSLYLFCLDAEGTIVYKNARLRVYWSGGEGTGFYDDIASLKAGKYTLHGSVTVFRPGSIDEEILDDRSVAFTVEP